MNQYKEIKKFEDLKDLVLLIEEEFPVNDWKFNGIHLWPLIRLELFFYLRKELYNKKNTNNVFTSNNQKKSTFSLKILTYLSLFGKSISHLIFVNTLKKKKFFFVASNSHRVSFNGSYFNRFFDTIINVNNLKNKSIFLEIGKKKINELANSDIIYSYNKILDNYKAYRIIRRKFVKEPIPEINLKNYDQLLNYLDRNQISSGFSKKYSQAKLLELLKNEYSLRLDLFDKILNKICPEKVIVLCYYTDLALIAAANKLNIETIDLQHGAQTLEHLAYGSWSKVPDTGYDFLPRTFWNWNESSKHVIESWSNSNKRYKSFVGGNVWVDYWMSEKSKYKYEYKNYILYTLQPDIFSLEDLFSEHIINAIKTSGRIWFVRLHPRALNEMQNIMQLLKHEGVLEKVNLYNATNDPLPLIIKNCVLHITHSSSTVIEAALMNKQTILLDETGKLYYSDLLESGAAYYYPVDKELGDFITRTIESVYDKINSVTSIDVKKYFGV